MSTFEPLRKFCHLEMLPNRTLIEGAGEYGGTRTDESRPYSSASYVSHAGRQKKINVSWAAMPNAAIALAIGTALALPARPTSGAATAPIENCTTPSNAAALPATCVSL